MKTVTLEFNLGDEVAIKGLPGKTGVIIAIFIDNTQFIQYRVRYLTEEEPKEIYFYKWELEAA